MRTLASIQRIDALTEHGNADSLEIAHVLGWQCIVRKGEFQVGDLVVYFEVDSVLPEAPEFEFLRKVKFRIKTLKLRGRVSQGLVWAAPNGLTLGEDVTALFGVTKYEPPEFAQGMQTGRCAGNWPAWLPKTDETRIQNCAYVLAQANDPDTLDQWYAAEKLDGSSMTVAWYEGQAYVCSRNVVLDLEDDSSAFVHTAKRCQFLIDGLRDHAEYLGLTGCAIQGELIGPKIQGNKYALKDYQFRPFTILEFRKGRVSRTKLDVLRSLAGVHGLDICPIRHYGQPPLTVAECVGQATCLSLIAPVPAEGLVWRLVGACSPGEGSFKVINPEWLLRYDA